MRAHIAVLGSLVWTLIQQARAGPNVKLEDKNTPTYSFLASQESSITTLPPAQPTGGDLNPCDFSDRSALLDRVASDWQGYNVSLLVEKCPGVCILIYGDGNPDVAGVGAMISYLIQFISFLLMGPVLHVLTAFGNLWGDYFNQFLDMIQEDLVESTNVGNTWIMASIMVAAAVRLSQSPPVFEIDFMSDLLKFQCMLATGRAVMSIVFYAMNEATSDKTERQPGWLHRYLKVCMMVIFAAFSWVWFMYLTFNTNPFGAQSMALDVISRFCTYEKDLPVPIALESGNDPKFTVWGFILYCLFSLFMMVITFLIYANADRRVLYSKNLLFWRWPTVPLLILGTWGLWSWLIATYLLSMQNARNIMEMALGQKYQDTIWGFGQITILIMWLPTLFQVLSTIYQYKPEKYKSQPANIDDDQYQLQPLPTKDADNDEDNIVNGTGRTEEVISSSVSRTVVSTIGDNDEEPSSLRQRTSFPKEFKQQSTWPRGDQGTYLPK